MGPMYCIGLDVHKQKISYCVKDNSRKILSCSASQIAPQTDHTNEQVEPRNTPPDNLNTGSELAFPPHYASES
jgi:hypothetical protein